MEITLEAPRDSQKELFAEAVTKYRNDMYRACRALLDSDIDAEDSVSEAVLRAWQSFGSLRSSKALKSWLIKIAVNCAYEHRRKTAGTVLENDMESLAGEAAETRDFGLWDAVMRLPEEFRAVTVMYYFDDMPTKDIAASLGIKKGTVRSRLSRARAMLKTVLEEE